MKQKESDLKVTPNTMTYKQEDIDVAEKYSNDLSTQNGFLAGCEHKQKEVDKKDAKINELVKGLEDLLKNGSADKAIKLIKKYSK